MRAVDAHDLAQQPAVALVHDHQAILSRDEQAMARGVGNHVVPAALTTQKVRARDRVLRRGGCGDTKS